jgi:hypothetical protein
LLVLGGFSEKVAGRCLFDQTAVSSEISAGESKDSSHDCSLYNPSSAQEIYLPAIRSNLFVIALTTPGVNFYPQRVVSSIERPPKSA